MEGVFPDTNCQYDVSSNPRIPLGPPGKTVESRKQILIPWFLQKTLDKQHKYIIPKYEIV